jgi:hypothetical protein
LRPCGEGVVIRALLLLVLSQALLGRILRFLLLTLRLALLRWSLSPYRLAWILMLSLRGAG